MADDFVRDLTKELSALAEKMQNDPQLMTEINQILANKYDPYVPYITGALAGNITVDENGITYNQPYAEEVYESMRPHNLEEHPLASSHWDEVAFANHRDEISQEVKEKLEEWIMTKIKQ